MKDDTDYQEKESTASCYLDDIQSIVFGGLTSRFWLLRKHINSLDKYELNKLPFYSWQCITL